MKDVRQVIQYFPNNIYNILVNALTNNPQIEKNLQEIRVRVGRPILLKGIGIEAIVEYLVTQQEILQTLEKLCDNSIYAYKNQISQGFITVRGGHRIGIAGTAVVENDDVQNLKYITSLNFRIAREVLNCSDKILKEIIDIENNNIYNTLIISPPGKGKTTILRDTIRRLSNGIEEWNFRGKTCGVVDERGEIAAMYRGIPQNDVGLRTDVIENISKSKGMKMLIRSMAPEIIACDEIGSKEDVQAIKEAISSGVKGIFTMHGKSLEDVKNNSDVNFLIENKLIEKVIFIQ